MIIEPVGYLDFLGLLKKCTLVLTDSGGVQEALILKNPCITLRDSTERWETLLLRANRLFLLYRNGKHYSLTNVIEELLSTRITGINPYGEQVTPNMLNLLSKLIKT